MATNPRRTGTRRAPGGLIAAYVLVVALIVASALLAFGTGGGVPNATAPALAAMPDPPAEPPYKTGSLKVPPKPVPVDFRILPPAEAAEMIEVTAEGLRLPRISPSGWMPWIANSRRFDPSGPPARIGLLMINVGADEALMQRAIEDLPGEVSLAFLPSTPELPRRLRQARDRGHETYLMLPVEDPSGLAERGIRPIETSADTAENLRRLLAALARGEGYVGVVVRSPGPVSRSDAMARPLVREVADRGLAVVEINPSPDTSVLHHLAIEMGAGYARSADILDYKLAGEGVAGNLERLAAWVAETAPGQEPRHALGIVQPDNEAIDAIVAWHKQAAARPGISLVPVIGHFECRDACMARVRAQPAQLLP